MKRLACKKSSSLSILVFIYIIQNKILKVSNASPTPFLHQMLLYFPFSFSHLLIFSFIFLICSSSPSFFSFFLHLPTLLFSFTLYRTYILSRKELHKRLVNLFSLEFFLYDLNMYSIFALFVIFS